MIDYNLAVYDRLWALLLAQPDIETVVKPGNRINFNSQDPWPKREEKTDPASFPMLRIEYGDGTLPSYTVLPRYEFSSFNPTTQNMKMAWSQDYIVTIIHRTARIQQNGVLDGHVQRAILLGGPRLGGAAVSLAPLPYVKGMGQLRVSHFFGVDEDTNGNKAQKTQIIIPVSFEDHLTSIVT